MSNRKVFYPDRDATLRGVLNDAHVTLRGVLSDAHVTLRGVSDIWAYRENIDIRSGFLLATQMIIMNAIKELDIKGGVTLHTDDIAVVSTKDVSDLSADLVLEILLATSMRKTVELQEELAISYNVQHSVRRWIDSICPELMLGGNIASSFLARALDAECGVQIIPVFGNLAKSIDMRCADLAFAVDTDWSLSLSKSICSESSGISIGAAVKAVARRFREVEDLNDVTFDQVADWTIHKFYYVEG